MTTRKKSGKPRSAKQLANDKRLGLAAKKRAAERKANPVKLARKKKTTSRKVAKRKATRAVRNPKRVSKRMSHLWIIFKCRGKSVSYVNFGTTSRFAFTSKKGLSALFLTKSEAMKVAANAANSSAGRNGQIGVTSADTSSYEIRRVCGTKM